MLIVAVFLSSFYNKKIMDDNKLNYTNTLGAISRNIQTNLSELESICFTPYFYEDIQTAMIYMKNGFMIEAPSYIDTITLERNYIATFSKLMHTSEQKIRNINFYPFSESDDYMYIIAHNMAGLVISEVEGYFNEPWFSNLDKNNRTYINFKNDIKTNDLYLHYYHLIYDTDSRKNIGVLEVKLSAQKLLETMNQIDISDYSQLIMIDNQNNDILYQSGQHNIEKQDIESLNKKYLITSTQINGTNWILYYLTENSQLYLYQIFTFFVAFIMCCAIIFIALLIYKQESRSLVASVNKILYSLTNIEKGDFSIKCDIDGETELTSIAQGVNKMSHKLKKQIDLEYKAVIERQKAEYRALQAQINPHFLYNILNDFVALNRMEERDMLEQAIFQLTQMFRYTCNISDNATVKEEIDFCTDYLKLHQLRLEERLTFQINVDEQCLNKTIPKLIIQPLIENSVVHGFGDTEEALNINIDISLHENLEIIFLKIQVKDNGIGFDTQRFPIKGQGVAINNIENRIKLISQNSNLYIQSSPKNGTICTIEIPMNM